MCANQMVQRNDYSSINMLGVILILCFGVLFVVINTFLERIVAAFRSRGHEGQAVTPWRMHHVLQLQSMLYEVLGVAVWDREALVPVTVDRARFSLPDVEKLGEISSARESLTETTRLRADASHYGEGKSAGGEGVYLLDIPDSNALTWSNDIGRFDSGKLS